MEPALITVPVGIPMVALVGSNDAYLRIFEKTFPDISITVRGNEIFANGDLVQLDQFESLIKELLVLLRAGQLLTEDAVLRSTAMIKHDPIEHPAEVLSLNILSNRGKTIRPKTSNQKRYVEAIDDHTITFGIGPAGTGKTYLAVACAVDALERSAVQRIVLTRPAVEAGERLGFLPGDLTQKIDPYLRPLYDALYDLMGYDKVHKAFERQMLEVAPLAFMRGRTLNNAFVILDEAQNTTTEQMKMFLTRIGFGSKAVVTGDVSQIDLPKTQVSGLIDAERVLQRVQGIAMCRFTSADVVRHPLVARIVDAYDQRKTPSA